MRRVLHFMGLILVMLGIAQGVIAQTIDQKQGTLPLPYLTNAAEGLVYDASMTYKDFQASGLLVMKRIEKDHYHVAFLSKVGPTIMEFRLTPKGTEWIKIVDRMDTKIIKRLIGKDFSVLLLTALDKQSKVKLVKVNEDDTTYKVKGNLKIKLTANGNNLTSKAETRSFINPLKIFTEFLEYKNSIPNKLTLRHRNIKMKVKMSLLEMVNDEK